MNFRPSSISFLRRPPECPVAFSFSVVRALPMYTFPPQICIVLSGEHRMLVEA